jgi:6-phosphogluconate dehydrogenase
VVDESRNVSLGMVGLGRMGANLSRRAAAAGHGVVGFDRNPDLVSQLNVYGVRGTDSLRELVDTLPAPRTVWIMVPAGPPTQSVIDELAALLDPGDTIIDGGNSYYRDDIAHSHQLASSGISFIDVGTSGGVWGLERGYCLMIGGSSERVEDLAPLWDALAPGVDTAPRTDNNVEESIAERGWLHCGPSGAGHYVKMVHNGIEYALMAAYAEGFNILKHANSGAQTSQVVGHDAETAPLSNPEFYQYDIDIPAVAEVWRRGSVIGSWLLDLTASALAQSPELTEFSGRVSDSGEGRWTSIAAIEEGVPAPVLTSALYSRFASQGNDHFANQILSAMRKGFGGHDEKTN